MSLTTIDKNCDDSHDQQYDTHNLEIEQWEPPHQPGPHIPEVDAMSANIQQHIPPKE
ncbi:hypothetical protein C0991_010471, partial [Blastosporella zonata]